MSCSARKIAFARYASSAPAGWRAQLLVAARLIWHVKSTGLYMPNHALKELEMHYAISSSVKALCSAEAVLLL
ncbi:hypothetical protein CGSMWGv00703Bmash_01719 [Gardnerella pickettii 00703Bmash]|nr:hypothetical protein CGSMWGv00703Bmash_01719 [Gardnerella pickettii 00703Bmash]